MRRLLISVTAVLIAFPVLTSPARADSHNCSNYASQAAAQAALRANPSDPNGLDGPPGPASSGTPGVACEDRPGPRDENPVQIGAAPAAASARPAVAQPAGVPAGVQTIPKAGGMPIAGLLLLGSIALGVGVSMRRLFR